MRLNRFTVPALVLAPLVMAVATPVQARLGGWGDSGWDSSGWGSDRWGGAGNSPRAASRSRQADGPIEGHVEVSRFVAEGEAAKALTPGAISVTGAPTGSGVESRELATYEAAVADQLAQLGYRTDTPAAATTQVTELHIGHDVVAPAEEKRNPVSGEMSVGVSNRGSMVGMAVNVDMTKPRGALIATRLEVRIRDKASGAVLWEGRADITTREGDEKWSNGMIASKLAAALFDHFPGTSGVEGMPGR